MAISLSVKDAMIAFWVDTCWAFLFVINPRWLTTMEYDGGTDPVSQQTIASSRGTLVHTSDVRYLVDVLN